MLLKKVKLLSLFFIIAGISVARAQYKQFRSSPAVVVAGQSFDIAYDASGTSLSGMGNVKGIAYYYADFGWHGIDLKLSSTEKNKWSATVNSQKNWAMVAFKFMAGDSVDSNSGQTGGFLTPYAQLLRNPEDTARNAKGALAIWGLFRSSKYGFEIPDYLNQGKFVTDTVVSMYLQKELEQNHLPEYKSAFAVAYATSMYGAYGESSAPKISAVVNYLTRKNAPQTDMLSAWQILHNTQQPVKADSLGKAIEKKYSGSFIAKLEAYKAFAAQKDQAKMKEQGEEFLKKYPYDPVYAGLDRAYQIDYNRVYLTVILLQIGNNDFSVIDRYIDQLPYLSVINVYYKTVQIAHHRQSIDDKYLYTYSELLLKRMQAFKTNVPEAYQSYSPEQWLRFYNDYYIAGFFPMVLEHISVCRGAGKYEEGLQYAREAESFQHYSKESLNDDYVFLLNKTGHSDEVNEVLIKSIYENQVSAPMLDLLKQNYISKYKSEAGFEKYLQSLKNASASKLSKEDLTMINKAMVNWTMTDLKGKKISLVSLRGKTVVMDFWATWCVPCKASLPGMNLAVQRYKNDPNVVFYFVDTEETEPDYKQQIRQYLKDNGYTFNVLFDNPMLKGKGTGEVFARVSKAFQISGVPLKLIIDKNGVVRYMTSGFKGSATALSDEIAQLIELTKKQN
ncbi:TlpA family protein disulfide reductase [Mucilaginibacter rubeus]|uniref:TlpA family protein disulfide reductase n=1 Tax=Mucilaginibacter rubeus TaxID=2027860 RepID=A0AAE6JKT5_9SPHI|nr:MULTISPECIES: TlpA disulfide reductase family protein [Mucilaginibacter]QEM07153.1 TlpA family protein disulfide reductase [Mucilaginibacter rubeus]QEM19608.1 TlpA family protein disulfide reductase [Mucilaginibacter gossypii]QTE43702.1 TlpA family protein disulfide reductase [Mucilaginibacter rubeus]QTE50302.1 TlpA family protein disulfide reductase [Mucilaginibacter rubeus]QTE55389.1 TlpA family protein disulfide reductase [Mucilaginibacter rubeus]